MKCRLDQNQQEKIRKWYHDHPLLCACQEAFENYQASMRYLMFSPTEVFVESVEVIDNILEEGTDKEGYIQGLWRELLIRYKLWPLIHPGAVDDNEYETAVSSVLYSVAIVLSRHEECYYNEQMKDAVLAEIEKHTSIVKQEEDKVIVSLSKYADELEQWINDYASIDSYLSYDIDDVAQGSPPRSSMKVVRKRNSIKGIKGVMKPENDYSRYSFRLNINAQFLEKKLEALYVMLSERDDNGKRFIEGDIKRINEVGKDILSMVEGIKDESIREVAINKYLFNQVFSGQKTDVRIVWTGNANELWYLINNLYNYYIEKKVEGRIMKVRLLEKSGLGPGIWQIVCSRFLSGKKRKVFDEGTGKKVETNEPIEFKEKDFHRYSEKNSPRNTSVLNAIIKKIAPPRVKTDKEAIEEDTDPWAYGIKSPSNPEELDGDFHDTNHKGRFE